MFEFSFGFLLISNTSADSLNFLSNLEVVPKESKEFQAISQAFQLTNLEDDKDRPSMMKQGWGTTDKSVHYPDAKV